VHAALLAELGGIILALGLLGRLAGRFGQSPIPLYLLVARGEFSIVIAGLAASAGAGSRLGALATAYVLILVIVGPLAARLPSRSPGARRAATPLR
jgi:Kef-type K+ transport system membrane component KefB